VEGRTLNQPMRLWRMNILDLNILIPHGEKAERLKWANGLPKGTSLYALVSWPSVLEQQGQVDQVAFVEGPVQFKGK